MFHGNYCGPYWSAGKIQQSVLSNVAPIDDFDATCKEHDGAYARQRMDNENGKLVAKKEEDSGYRNVGIRPDGTMITTEENKPWSNDDYKQQDKYAKKYHDLLKEADLRFAKQNIGKGVTRTVAGLVVGTQGILRGSKNMTRLRRQPTPRPTKLANARSGQNRTGNDRSVGAPVAVSTRRTTVKPKITSSGTGVVVSHRTFLSPIVCQAAYTAEKFSVNPAMGSTFPWLAKVAARYDKYRFKQLKFEYRSVTATSTTGVIMMSFDYDASDDPPATKLDQSQTVPNSENNAWMNNNLVVPVDAKWRFTRQGAIDGDIKTYDLGNMFISSLYGAGAVSGELYVTYVVELDKPTHPAPLAMTGSSSAPTSAAPLAEPYTVGGKSQAFERLNDTQIKCIIPGEYFLSIRIFGTGITAFNLPTASGTSAKIAETFTTTQGLQTSKLRVSKNDTVNLDQYTATTITSHVVIITEIDYDIV